ncbi:MAG TPA: M48 family metalloprotease [Alphaproteobacteria bacterium]
MPKILLGAVICAGFLLGGSAAMAQGLIRDTEIETDIRRMATPIWQQAGLRPSDIRVAIIGDDTINAFVAGGQNIFLYTGLILDTHDIGELLGVIAHETGHITGGHLIRTRQNMEDASMESIIGALAGVAAGVAAGDAGAGMATITATQQMTMSKLLSNSRTYESSADQAGLSFMERAGYSAEGTAHFLERLAREEMLPEMQQSQYMLTHPLSQQRLDAVEDFVKRSSVGKKEYPDSYKLMHARIKAKILGFTTPQTALRTYKDKTDMPSRYGYAIGLYRTGKVKEALDILVDLQKANPNDPYIQELQGQILFENGRIAESIPFFQKALEDAPEAGLIRIALAHAYLENRNAHNLPQAIDQLNRAKTTEYRTSSLFRLLATAYGRNGQEAQAKLALAEEALLKRDNSFAIYQATTARKMLPESEKAARQRASDIIELAQQYQRQKAKN